MFQVTSAGVVSRVREASRYGLRYDLLLSEMEGYPNWEIELLFVLSPESDKLQREAAREILSERGIYV